MTMLPARHGAAMGNQDVFKKIVTMEDPQPAVARSPGALEMILTKMATPRRVIGASRTVARELILMKMTEVRNDAENRTVDRKLTLMTTREVPG
jgi:hypothetical protein